MISLRSLSHLSIFIAHLDQNDAWDCIPKVLTPLSPTKVASPLVKVFKSSGRADISKAELYLSSSKGRPKTMFSLTLPFRRKGFCGTYARRPFVSQKPCRAGRAQARDANKVLFPLPTAPAIITKLPAFTWKFNFCQNRSFEEAIPTCVCSRSVPKGGIRHFHRIARHYSHGSSNTSPGLQPRFGSPWPWCIMPMDIMDGVTVGHVGHGHLRHLGHLLLHPFHPFQRFQIQWTSRSTRSTWLSAIDGSCQKFIDTFDTGFQIGHGVVNSWKRLYWPLQGRNPSQGSESSRLIVTRWNAVKCLHLRICRSSRHV